MIQKLLCRTSLAIFFFQSANAQHLTRPEVKKMDSYLSKMSQLGVFSGSVLFAQNDTILFNKGYGFANRRLQKPINTATLFDIGSVAKQFTATAILKLKVENKLSLSDSIGQFFKNVPDDKRGITIEQLLTHTSMLPPDIVDVTKYYDFAKKKNVIGEILKLPLLNNEHHFSYSNPGYILLAAIIEEVSKMKFQDYLTQKLFKPFGLTNTGFLGNAKWNSNVNTAHAYWDQYDEFRDEQGKYAGAASWNTFGSAGLYSTPSDLYKWFMAVYSNKVLPQAETQSLFSPHVSNYGYGWFLIKAQDGSVRIIYHNGSADAFETAIRYYPARKLFTAITSSSKHQDAGDQHDEYLNDCLNIFLGRSHAQLPEISKAFDGKKIEGIYIDEHDTASKWKIWKDASSQLWFAPMAGGSWKIFSVNPDSDVVRLESAKHLVDSLLKSFKSKMCRSSSIKLKIHLLMEDWEKEWCSIINAYGSLKKQSFIIYLPLFYSSPRVYVFSRLDFQKKSVVATWLCENDHLVESWLSSEVKYPNSYRLTPSSKDDFIIFDPFNRQSIQLHYTRMDQNQTGLIITASERQTTLIKK